MKEPESYGISPEQQSIVFRNLELKHTGYCQLKPDLFYTRVMSPTEQLLFEKVQRKHTVIFAVSSSFWEQSII